MEDSWRPGPRRNEAWEALVPHYARNPDFRAYLEELWQRWPDLSDDDYEPLRERFGLRAPWLKQWVADTFNAPENQAQLCWICLDIAGEDGYYLMFEPPSLPKPEAGESRSEWEQRAKEQARQYEIENIPPDIRATDVERDAEWLYRRICEKRPWGKIDRDYPAKSGSRNPAVDGTNLSSTVRRAVKRLADDLGITLPEGRRGRPPKRADDAASAAPQPKPP